MNKVLNRDAMKDVVARLRAEGKTVAFTNGCFDILHVGHVRYLGEARKQGDVLVLGLNSDASVRAIKGDKRPLVPQAERAEVLASLTAVDYITLFDETTPLSLIEALRPDCIIKGGDWTEEAVVGRESVRSWGGRVVIIPMVPGASTTNVIRKILATYEKD